MVAVQQNRNAFSTGKCNRPGECVCCVKALRVIIHTLLIQTSSRLRRIQKDRSAFAVSKFKIRVIVPSWSGSLYIGKCVGNIPEKVSISIGRETVSFCNYIKTGGQKPQQRGHGSDGCVQIHIWCIDDIPDSHRPNLSPVISGYKKPSKSAQSIEITGFIEESKPFQIIFLYTLLPLTA